MGICISNRHRRRFALRLFRWQPVFYFTCRRHRDVTLPPFACTQRSCAAKDDLRLIYGGRQISFFMYHTELKVGHLVGHMGHWSNGSTNSGGLWPLAHLLPLSWRTHLVAIVISRTSVAKAICSRRFPCILGHDPLPYRTTAAITQTTGNLVLHHAFFCLQYQVHHSC